MPTYGASVKKALKPDQQDLIDHKEHCSADPEKLATVGRAPGHQVRIKRNDYEYALYTVSEKAVRQESPENIVRMGEAGRVRLGTSDESAGTLDSQVPHPTFTDEQQASDHDEFIEQLYDNGRNREFIVIAPHGGFIEEGTDVQADLVEFLLTCELKIPSSWVCKGFKREGGAFDRWHITSTDIHEASFPLLRKVVLRGFRHAVAFHGYTPEPGQPDILVGGTSPLREEIVMAIKDAVAGSDIAVELPDPIRDKHFNGDSLLNIVNRLTANGAGGVQIEQSKRVRDEANTREAIARAVARVYANELEIFEGCRKRRFPGIVDLFCVIRSLPFNPRFIQCAIAAARGRPPRL